MERSRAARLFRLDVGRADHLAPLLRFAGDELAEVGRRTMSDSRHKLRNARPIVATNRETKTFAVKYA